MFKGNVKKKTASGNIGLLGAVNVPEQIEQWRLVTYKSSVLKNRLLFFLKEKINNSRYWVER